MSIYSLKSRHIVVEGAIGAGKTSLVLKLSQKFQARTILEIVEENPFLSRFYEDIKGHAFQTQIFFLLSRYEQQKKILQQESPYPLFFSDYMMAKDRIFAHLNLSGYELAMYEKLYQLVSQNIPDPDLIIYLKSKTDALIHRIMLRNRAFERKITYQYLDRLNEAYHHFFSNPKNIKNSKLITIDMDQLDFVGKEKDFESICQIIQQKDQREE